MYPHKYKEFTLVDYILGDRGSVEIVTDGYYEAETLQVFEELHIDRERIWFGEAHLVPEPDNPYEPKCTLTSSKLAE